VEQKKSQLVLQLLSPRFVPPRCMHPAVVSSGGQQVTAPAAGSEAVLVVSESAVAGGTFASGSASTTPASVAFASQRHSLQPLSPVSKTKLVALCGKSQTSEQPRLPISPPRTMQLAGLVEGTQQDAPASADGVVVSDVHAATIRELVKSEAKMNVRKRKRTSRQVGIPTG